MVYAIVAAVSFLAGAVCFAGLLYVGWMVERPTLTAD